MGSEALSFELPVEDGAFRSDDPRGAMEPAAFTSAAAGGEPREDLHRFAEAHVAATCPARTASPEEVIFTLPRRKYDSPLVRVVDLNPR